MSFEAWECPRCGRMNAPMNPSCFCRRKTDYTMIDGVCTECGGFYGILEGNKQTCHCGKERKDQPAVA